MATSSSLSSLIETLEAAGWRREWMIREPLLHLEGKPWRPDAVLRIGLYPVAVIELTSQTEARQAVDPSIADGGQGLLRLAWDGDVVKDIEKSKVKWKSFPSPDKLWKYMGRTWDEYDPRLLPPLVAEHLAMGLPHSLALSRMLDALLAGERRVRAGVPMASDMTTVAIEMCWRMLATKRFEHALVVVERTDEAENVLQRLSVQRDVHITGVGSTRTGRGIEVGTMGYFMARGWEHLLELDQERYDLVIVPNLRKTPAMGRLLEHFPRAGLGALHSSFSRDLADAYGRLVYEHPVDDVLSEAAWQPPPGTQRVWLGDVTSIRQGTLLVNHRSREETVSAAIVNGRDVVRHGGRPGKTERVLRSALERNRLQRGDILLPTIVAESWMQLPVAVVPDLGDELVVGSHTVLVVRLVDSRVDPQELVDFLRGPLAMMFVRAVASGTAATHQRIFPRNLSRLPIFLRVAGEATDQPRKINQYSVVLESFRTEILPALETLVQADEPQAEGASQVAAALRQALQTLEPPSLESKVLERYPTPIALAWRRYHDARFDTYERAMRLRDVFEAAAFFVYNVMLMDYLRNPKLKHCTAGNSDARRAWRGGNMPARMDFVSALLEHAAAGARDDLFLSGLVGTNVVGRVKDLHGTFRYRLAHSAAASEGVQKQLVGQYEPDVRALLEELGFLEDIVLAQVPAYFRRNGVTMRRVERYRGPARDVGEEEVQVDDITTAADQEHLVLLDAERGSLDLYPVYQLVTNEDTYHECHLCFMKSAKESEKVIRGEDTQTARDLDLEGYDVLAELHKARKA